MNIEPISADILKNVPKTSELTLKTLLKEIEKEDKKVVILDDDPTGTQTVKDIPILTNWDYDNLRKEVKNKDYKAFYILTNTRAMNEEEAALINYEIGSNLRKIETLENIELEIISRSDSTLRGHFPMELRVLEQSMNVDYDGWIIIPYFEEGKRYTKDDIHYVEEGNELIPIGMTQFAKDHTFGFKSSNLKEWVEEKNARSIKKENIKSISLEDIRVGRENVVKEKLLNLNKSDICIVNAMCMEDMNIFNIGLLQSQQEGKRFLFRTAASFIKSRLGIENNNLLTKDDLCLDKKRGGIIIAGSYVNKTTLQIKNLLENTPINKIEIDIEKILNQEGFENYMNEIVSELESNINLGKDTIIYTSRRLITGINGRESLNIGNKISNGLVKIIKSLESTPKYIVAKGGITSSDIATKGIQIEKAIVKGQILAGVPVWKATKSNKFTDINYIVFPGNVGEETSLTNLYNKLN